MLLFYGLKGVREPGKPFLSKAITGRELPCTDVVLALYSQFACLALGCKNSKLVPHAALCQ